MKNIQYSILVYLLYFSFCSPSNLRTARNPAADNSIVKLDMFLSAFGVESDGFPSVKASVDFINNSARCYVSYYDPAFKDTSYSLDLKEIDSIRLLLTGCNLRALKKEYTSGSTDQPISTTTIYTVRDTFYIKDYSLQGNAPLPDLYRIVYKLNKNYR